jgi:hypothetical protein
MKLLLRASNAVDIGFPRDMRDDKLRREKMRNVC